MKKFLRYSLVVLITTEILFIYLFLKPQLERLPSPEMVGEYFFPTSRPGGIFQGVPESPPQRRGKTFHFFPFTRNEDLKKWEDKILQGKVRYWIDFEEKNGFIEAEARRTSSAKYYRITYDIKTYPYLAWWWKVSHFPEKTKEEGPEQLDDYPTRMYVIFASRFFRNFSCVEYVWDNLLPEGTVQTSPFTPHIRQMVLRSGAKDGKWCYEERNVLEDFRKLFGRVPQDRVRAIAFMTDADNTQSMAGGFFDDIWMGSLPKGA